MSPIVLRLPKGCSLYANFSIFMHLIFFFFIDIKHRSIYVPISEDIYKYKRHKPTVNYYVLFDDIAEIVEKFTAILF